MSLPCSSFQNCILEFIEMTETGDTERIESALYDVADEPLEMSIALQASPSLSASLSQSMAG